MFQKKTAICFSGQGRFVEFTHENLKEYLINPFKNVDIFAYIANDENAINVLKYIPYTEISIKDDFYHDESGINHCQRGPLQDYLRMNWSRKKVNEMRLQYEKIHNVKYDIVIHSRLDVKYFTPLSMFKIDQMDMNYVFVPDFHNYSCVQGNGLNDRFVLGNSKNMDIFFNLYDYIREDSNLGYKVHGESTLARLFQKNNIQTKKIPIRFTRIGKDGKERDPHLTKDKSFWQQIERN